MDNYISNTSSNGPKLLSKEAISMIEEFVSDLDIIRRKVQLGEVTVNVIYLSSTLKVDINVYLFIFVEYHFNDFIFYVWVEEKNSIEIRELWDNCESLKNALNNDSK